MPRMRIAAAMVVGLGLVFGFQVGAVAADDEAVPSRLTIQGQPLAQIVRTEPMAPFLAFEPGLVRIGPRAESAVQTPAGSTRRGNRAKKMLIGGAIGVGAGWFMGHAAGANEGGGYLSDYAGIGALTGLGIGLGIGALLGN